MIPTLKLSGLDEALAEIDRRLAVMHRDVREDLEWFGKGATDEMVETHTFQNRTFRLETSIGYRTTFWSESTGWRVEVFAEADYADQVEFGHPGARPYPFFWPVFWTWFPDRLFERMQVTMEESLNGDRE